MNMNSHFTEISRLRREADQLPEDNPSALMQKIELLAKCLVFIGRVSSVLDGEYKRVYANRKYEQALAHTRATKDKAAQAEIAVKDLREEEAQAYEYMQRWRNAFTSTNEEINSLKLKLRIDFADGSGGNGYTVQQRNSAS